MNQKNGFTVLRLIAALLVMVSHAYELCPPGARADPLALKTHLIALSTLGVDSFFVISGFLITQSLRRDPSILTYLRNRFLRICPALWVVLLLSTLVLGPMVTLSPDYWHSKMTYDYLWTATIYGYHEFLPGVFAYNPIHNVNGSLWTIPIEVMCYGILLIVSWSGALNWRGCVALIAVLLLLHLSAIFPRGEYLLRIELIQLNRFAILFFGGGLLASLGDRVAYRWRFMALAAVLVLAGLFLGQTAWQRFSAPYLLLWPYLVIALAFKLDRCDRLNHFDISYGVYLYSFIVQQCLVQLFAQNPHFGPRSLMLASLPITLFCAILSWQWVEKPALRLKSRRAMQDSLQISGKLSGP